MNTYMYLLTLCIISVRTMGAVLIPGTFTEPEVVPAPVRFYSDLKCFRMYDDSNGNPRQYDCPSIQARDASKCYLHGTEYAIGETVFGKFRGIKMKCRCARSDRHPNTAFRCPRTKCHRRPATSSNCYRQRNITAFCPGPEICPQSPLDRHQCLVNGQTILDGNYFRTNKLTKECYCGPGYEGKNKKPYCVAVSRNPCHAELLHSMSIARGCVPVFELTQAPRLECPAFFTCPHPGDRMDAHRFALKRISFVRCKFGNTTMRYGEVLALHQNRRYDGCIKCFCSAGPLPTCLFFPNLKCSAFSFVYS